MDPSKSEGAELKNDDEIIPDKTPAKMQVKGGMTTITDITGKKPQDLINEHPVMMFSKSYCPFCRQAKELFTE